MSELLVLNWTATGAASTMMVSVDRRRPHRQVDRDVAALLHADILLLGLLEALQLRGDV